jgi:uncharacterized NAD(P)/FAD-binding protein YdhS
MDLQFVFIFHGVSAEQAVVCHRKIEGRRITVFSSRGNASQEKPPTPLSKNEQANKRPCHATNSKLYAIVRHDMM